MDIKHVQKNNTLGYFIAVENSTEFGRITYVITGQTKLVIEHTIVNPKYEGHGLGTKLVLTVVAYARENHLKIIPECPFAKAVFDKTPEIQDVLY